MKADEVFAILSKKIKNIQISGGGISNYKDLSGKPKINGVTLQGDLSSEDLGLDTGEISQESGNAIVEKPDGIYAQDKTEDIENLQSDVESIEDRIKNVKKYQKYVNVGLDNGLFILNNNYSPVKNTFVPFVRKAGNIDVENGLIHLKSGKVYQFVCSFSYTSSSNWANILYEFRSDVSDEPIAMFTPTRANSTYEFAYCTAFQYSPDEDCNVGLFVTEVFTSDYISKEYSSLSVFEISRVITIDPLEHVNEESGIEDSPVGTIISFMGTTAPKHYLACDGAEYEIADYPYLAEHIRDHFGTYNHWGGDGVTTFAVPPLSGEFLRGSGENSHENQGNGGEVGEHQDGTQIPRINTTGNLDVYKGVQITDFDAEMSTKSNTYNYVNVETTYGDPVSVGGKVRPTNTSVLYCIKYEPTYFMQIGGEGSGQDGKSAYEIAVENGFEGTEEEWLDSLKGEPGRSITAITTDDSNNVYATFSDGQTENIGKLNVNVEADFLTSEGFGNLRYYNGVFQYYDTNTETWVDTEATQSNALVVNLTPTPMQLMMGVYDHELGHYKLKWKEPKDTVIDGQVICVVEKVVIRRKLGSAPQNENDGEEVITINRPDFGAYENIWFVDSSLTPDIGQTYYYKAFPMSTSGFYGISFENETGGILAKDYWLFGFKLDQTEPDPESMITYIEDNAKFRPAYMNYEKDKFNYGDWGDSWFITGIKPCMLNYDGTVAYELDPDDYSKKKDGTDSDIANADFAGNAMVGISKVYWKIVDNGDDTANIYFSDIKADDNFVCWSHIDNDGNEIPYCYMPAYPGTLSSDKLRSLSGKTPIANKTAQQEIAYAKANNLDENVLWYTEVFSDRMLINLLLLLMGRSIDTQTTFGSGNNNSYVSTSNTGVKSTGTMNQKGLFWGDTGNKFWVKVFGMEHYWGNQWRRIAGWINANGTQKIKMTYGQGDGSTVEGYNLDGNGYVAIPNSTPTGTSGGYIKRMLLTEKGLMPTTSTGSATTYYTDGLWFNNSQIDYALVGGTSDSGLLVGALCSALNAAASHASWTLGAALSCKPLA